MLHERCETSHGVIDVRTDSKVCAMHMTVRLAVEVSELPGVASFRVEFRFVRVHATDDDIGTMVREVDLAN